MRPSNKAVNFFLLLSSSLFYQAEQVKGKAVPVDKDKFKVSNEYDIKGKMKRGTGFDDILDLEYEEYMGASTVTTCML